jgi:hypothetical protein
MIFYFSSPASLRKFQEMDDEFPLFVTDNILRQKLCLPVNGQSQQWPPTSSFCTSGTIFVTAVVEAVEEEHQRKRPKTGPIQGANANSNEALHANIKGTTLASGKTIRLLLLV